VKVSLRVHGGLAAAINISRPPTVVDTADLPSGKAADLARLVEAAMPPEPPPEPLAESAPAAGATHPDMQSYTVVVDDGQRTVTITRSDATMTREFADLLSWIQENASEGA
jgi:hypothetical protein